MKTYSARPGQVKQDWLIVDAAGLTLGRLATELAHRLRGKHKPEYTPHVDTGDFIVVVNADKVVVSGNKTEGKLYQHHTGYPGGLKTVNFKKLQDSHPERIIEKAVKGMLPKNKLGAKLFKNLHVFSDNDHKFEAQKPSIIDLNKVN